MTIDDTAAGRRLVPKRFFTAALAAGAAWLAAGCGGGETATKPTAAADISSQAGDAVGTVDLAPSTDTAAPDGGAGTDAGAEAANAPDDSAHQDAPSQDAQRAADVPDAPDAVDTAGALDSGDAADTGGPADAGAQVLAPASCTNNDDCATAAPCLLGACSAKGVCTVVAKAELAPCSDGNLCTTTDACSGGQCQGLGQLLCDDANPCTNDSCNALVGCLNLAKVGTQTCDDGEVCTVGDTCAAGKCQAGTNTCQCKTGADCGKFEDGDACNGTLYCDTGAAPYVCKVNPATVVTCSTGANSACQTNTCVPATGACKIVTKPTNTPCNDGNGCTEGDSCQSGLCEGGTNTCICKSDADCAKVEDGDKCNGTLYCNKATSQCALNPATVVTCQTVDDSACQKNLCNPKDGKCSLLPVNVGKACDDGNPCTPNETCQQGACHSATNVCECKVNADCASKEDGNLCNGTLFCDTKTYKCSLNEATIVTCPTGDDGPCVVDTCDTKTGKCSEIGLPKDGTLCTDGNTCTSGDVCKAGKCAAGPDICPCQNDADCAAKEDGNLCNGTLYCNKVSKTCELNPATVVQCSDAFDETCLTNQCDPSTGKCGMKPANQGNLCQDGSLCSAGGWCQLGVCVVEAQSVCECQSDADCGKLEDGNQCNGTLYCDKSGSKPKCAEKPGSVVVCKTTGDSECLKNQCEPASGACTANPVFATCNDGKACTEQDTCQNGACAGSPKACGDGEPCTTDACKEPFGCQYVPLAGSVTCSDNNACTINDVCVTGSCAGKPLLCDDANVCTADACQPAKGCQYTKILAACNDGDPCTLGDSCNAVGLCQAGTPTDCDDDNLCTADACDKASGKCSHTDSGAKTCGDGNPCTDDPCNAKAGCSHPFNTAQCNDKNACTTGDVCKGGACTSTALFACDDGKICTSDSCDPKTGCVFADNGKACDDGDPCTPGDACKGGLCVGGQTKNCDDKNQCTADVCDAKTGSCVNAQTTDSCTDGNACTQFDQCAAGKCVGKELVCDDANGCTTDGCAPASGCTVTDNTLPCDTGQCLNDDKCSAGKCVAGKTSASFATPLPVLAGFSVHAIGKVVAPMAAGGYLVAGAKKAGAAPSGLIMTYDAGGKLTNSAPLNLLMRTVGVVAGATVAAGVASAAEYAYVFNAQTGQFVATKGLNYAPSSALDVMGNVVHVGNVQISDGGKLVPRATVRRLKSDLTELWAYTAAKAEGFSSGALAATADVILAVGAHGLDANLVRLAPATGAVLSEMVLGGSDADTAVDVAALPGGGFAVVGSTGSKGAGASDGWLLRIGDGGQVLWERTFGTTAADGFASVASVDDGLMIGGWSSGKGGVGQENWLIATDRFGNVRWQRVWGTPGDDQIGNLLIDGQQRIVGIANANDSGGTLFRRDRWGHDSCAAAGVCTGKSQADCTDNNPCTVDFCDPSFGCKHIGMPTGSQCSDTAQCSATGSCTVPTGTVEIPAGKFWMGCAPGDVACSNDEKPLHEVMLSAYAIDRTEVTVDQYASCVAAFGCLPPSGTYAQESKWNWGAPGRGSHPLNGVSLALAKGYCAWAGKRLPTEAEWEKAARGGCDKFPNQDCKAAATTYPWGNSAPTCTYATYDNGSAGCGGGTTVPAGSRPAGASPYGVQDMAGGVSEWVSDAFSATYYGNSPSTDPQGPTSGNGSIKRGGGFTSSPAYVRISTRFSADPTTSYQDQGFRCAVSLK